MVKPFHKMNFNIKYLRIRFVHDSDFHFWSGPCTNIYKTRVHTILMGTISCSSHFMTIKIHCRNIDSAYVCAYLCTKCTCMGTYSVQHNSTKHATSQPTRQINKVFTYDIWCWNQVHTSNWFIEINDFIATDWLKNSSQVRDTLASTQSSKSFKQMWI